LNQTNYVLITAARNEEKFIEYPIKSILSQTILPRTWIIVSDGSTDRTDEIVSRYSTQHDFMQLIRRESKNEGLDFSSKANSIYEGYQQLKNVEYDFIGILDGDVSFSPSYYENILLKFRENDNLGVAGGLIFDKHNGRCIRRSPDDNKYVSGCIQLFRRKCYEDIGGILPIKEGGEDTVAVITARMRGWDVQAFDEFSVFHHKHSEAIRGVLKESFRNGKLFYHLGSHPAIELIKSAQRIFEKPFFLVAITRICGYALPYFKRQKRPVSDNFVKYMRKEQIARLRLELMKTRRALKETK
jgi:glycosyltransferase involved in cell wall biosynthesis